jgi:proteasome lid subunit RPN8/RPN11
MECSEKPLQSTQQTLRRSIEFVGVYFRLEVVLLSRSDHLLLPRQCYDAMIEHAQSEQPNECCGLLAGVIDLENGIWRVHKHYALINEAASPIEYRSEPRSMFQAIKDMRPHGYEIVAIYHSHPTSAPIPSRTDLERNYSTDVVSFIISLQGTEPILRGWWLRENSYQEAAWEIVEQ